MIAAILLAAGRSRRMGAFKPLLPFGGRTVLEACVANLRAAGVVEIVVVVGHRGDEVRARLQDQALRFAVNEAVASEMSVSIARGVAQLSDGAQAVLIALGDQPAVTPEVIRRVLETRAETGARLVVPEYEGRGGHPVLIDLAYRDELLNLDPARGLRALFDAHRDEVRRVPVASAYITRDMDTWADYCALHEEIFHAPPPLPQPAQSS
ncbi:MAG TPA: nucleotidyltransferase family protein [Pyrinomonadaceae bacterium]|nr:nucleotidyltransferase family protein [Pyrinomonadaceae bacterium]